MKKLLTLVVGWILIGASVGGTRVLEQRYFFEAKAQRATGAIFVMGKFNCSGTEVGRAGKDGIFLTARHCVASPDTDKFNEHMQVTFAANEAGPFYEAVPVAVSLTDDLALLVIVNGAEEPFVSIKPEWNLKTGDPIFNASYPLGFGKQVFHGEYMQSRFPVLPVKYLSEMPSWTYSMPMNLTIAHGSSGSGVFSSKEQALIGVTVGTTDEGTFNIAIPGDRVINFIDHLQDNTVDKFKKAFPEHTAPDDGWPF